VSTMHEGGAKTGRNARTDIVMRELSTKRDKVIGAETDNLVKIS
jgi:hypothetical protein